VCQIKDHEFFAGVPWALILNGPGCISVENVSLRREGVPASAADLAEEFEAF
jgi:hypothetical protein